MSKYLIKTQEMYRVDTDTEAENLINEAKGDSKFTLAKYNCESRIDKKTGEEWYRVNLTKLFTDEKEPITRVEVDYKKAGISNGTF